MNVECLSDPHSSVILVQKVDHKVCYSYDLLTQFLLFQPKMNALSKEMSVPQRCFASIERDRLLVAVILVLRWLVMKRRGLAKVPLLFWVSIIWCLVRSPFLRTPANNPLPPITATMVVTFERPLSESVIAPSSLQVNSCQSVLWIIISALDECDKQGDSCPSGLQCLKQANGSHVCGCSAGYKVIGEGEWRSCQGIIAKDSYPIAIYVYLERKKWEKTGVRLRPPVSREGTRASF